MYDGFVVIMCDIAEIYINSQVWPHLQYLTAYLVIKC